MCSFSYQLEGRIEGLHSHDIAMSTCYECCNVSPRSAFSSEDVIPLNCWQHVLKRALRCQPCLGIAVAKESCLTRGHASFQGMPALNEQLMQWYKGPVLPLNPIWANQSF